MKLQILSNCRADNRHLSIGEVVELPKGIADELLALGLAVIAPETEPSPSPALAPKPRRAKASPIPTPED